MKDISKEDMIQLLQTQEDGVMSLSDGDTPYCIPFGHVLVNDTVYLSLFPRGRKWEIIQKNPKVCFNVYSWNDDHTEWSSVVVDGVMESVTDINEIESVVKELIVKMGMDPEAYLEKRMTYYRDNLDNPKALKIYRINSSSMGGKTMPTMMGE
jgi:nitroimidazol reductase NimA-like FMN-containing flavoprotein (pyridoxamine 5'-phosphate oxidase superfamily)